MPTRFSIPSSTLPWTGTSGNLSSRFCSSGVGLWTTWCEKSSISLNTETQSIITALLTAVSSTRQRERKMSKIRRRASNLNIPPLMSPSCDTFQESSNLRFHHVCLYLKLTWLSLETPCHYFIWQLSFATFRSYCASRVGYVTTINEPTGSGRKLSDKMMTLYNVAPGKSH